jgi:hypothetical protein
MDRLGFRRKVLCNGVQYMRILAIFGRIARDKISIQDCLLLVDPNFVPSILKSLPPHLGFPSVAVMHKKPTELVCCLFAEAPAFLLLGGILASFEASLVILVIVSHNYAWPGRRLHHEVCFASSGESALGHPAS